MKYTLIAIFTISCSDNSQKRMSSSAASISKEITAENSPQIIEDKKFDFFFNSEYPAVGVDTIVTKVNNVTVIVDSQGILFTAISTSFSSCTAQDGITSPSENFELSLPNLDHLTLYIRLLGQDGNIYCNSKNIVFKKEDESSDDALPVDQNDHYDQYDQTDNTNNQANLNQLTPPTLPNSVSLGVEGLQSPFETTLFNVKITIQSSEIVYDKVSVTSSCDQNDWKDFAVSIDVALLANQSNTFYVALKNTSDPATLACSSISILQKPEVNIVTREASIADPATTDPAATTDPVPADPQPTDPPPVVTKDLYCVACNDSGDNCILAKGITSCNVPGFNFKSAFYAFSGEKPDSTHYCWGKQTATGNVMIQSGDTANCAYTGYTNEGDFWLENAPAAEIGAEKFCYKLDANNKSVIIANGSTSCNSSAGFSEFVAEAHHRCDGVGGGKAFHNDFPQYYDQSKQLPGIWTQTAADCENLCRRNSSCKEWTWYSGGNACYRIKESTTYTDGDAAYSSGRCKGESHMPVMPTVQEETRYGFIANAVACPYGAPTGKWIAQEPYLLYDDNVYGLTLCEGSYNTFVLVNDISCPTGSGKMAWIRNTAVENQTSAYGFTICQGTRPSSVPDNFLTLKSTCPVGFLRTKILSGVFATQIDTMFNHGDVYVCSIP